MTQRLFFDLRCNRCGYVFPMPLTDTSCPWCDAREQSQAREQRRYEIAREVLAAFAIEKRADINAGGYWPQEAVRAADALLAALEDSK